MGSFFLPIQWRPRAKLRAIIIPQTEENNMATYWLSKPPAECDTCSTPITTVFYDADTGRGWACMCPSCQTLGPGLGRVGPGRGQKYEKQADGKWLKTEG